MTDAKGNQTTTIEIEQNNAAVQEASEPDPNDDTDGYGRIGD